MNQPRSERGPRSPLGKTTRPSTSGILPRRRLFELFDQAAARPILWLSGPPGSGKTTAVASYLEQSRGDVLWYQLDEGDADVATFFYYLGLAVADRDASQSPPMPLLEPQYQAGLGIFTRRYFQNLFARLATPFTIVFDGHQEIAPDSQLHSVIRDALAELPPGGRVIVASRGEAPPELARLRASGKVAAAGWEALRLTREESDSMALQRRRDLPPAALERLYARTQGWAAGLVLLLEGAAGDLAESPDMPTGQVVFDYLAGEIFGNSSAITRELLLSTAFLPEMTVEMAAGVTGDERAGSMLAELHRKNYFVALRQSGPEAVYQYHPMFREFLLARVEQTLPKERRRQLQRAAAAAMESAGRHDGAVSLYREAHAWDEMARVVGAAAPTMLAQGRAETLGHWADELPPEVHGRHPWVVYWAAAGRAQLAPREGRVLHERAFDLFRGMSPLDLTGMALAASGAMDAILYELDDFSLLDRWITVLDETARSGVRYPSPEIEARVACSMVFSLTLRQPHRRDLQQWIERALGCARGSNDPNLRMFVGLLCALTLMWTGVFGKALALIEITRRVAAEPGVSPFSMLTLKNIEAMYYMLAAEAKPCLAAAREGLEIARATGVQTWSFQLRVYAYGGALAGGSLETAAKYARELEPHVADAGRFNLCLYHHFRAWEAMLRRDLMRAVREERIALGMAIEVGCPYFEALCRLALAEALAESGDERKCIAHLRQLRPIVEAIENRHLEFTCLAGVGRLALEHGRQRPGLKALGRALAIGREFGYAHFLWWRPAAMSRTCAYALSAGIEAEYVTSLIRRRGLSPESLSGSAEHWPWTFRVHTLGGFRLLRHGEPLASSGKAQRRPLEMLQALIANGGERVAEARIADVLWPRIDGDSAHRSFTSTLHRLRKLLGEDRAVVLHEGKLTLDPRLFWIDVRAIDALVSRIEALAREPRPDAGRLERAGAELIELYRGPFMGAEAEGAWHIERRDLTRGRVARAAAALWRAWEQAGQPARAREVSDKLAEADSELVPRPAAVSKA